MHNNMVGDNTMSINMVGSNNKEATYLSGIKKVTEKEKKIEARQKKQKQEKIKECKKEKKARMEKRKFSFSWTQP